MKRALSPRIAASLVGVMVLASLSLSAVPAQAADLGLYTLNRDCNQLETGSPATPTTTISGNVGDTFRLGTGGNCTGMLDPAINPRGTLTPNLNTTLRISPTTFTIVTSGTAVISRSPSPSINISIIVNSAPAPTPVTPSVPVVVPFALNLPTSVRCEAPTSTVQGTWVELPSANQCTGAGSSVSQARLLGWATTPDFPVAIAQRQAANNWGAYEIFGENGQITALYVPAGGYILVSGATNLYPIYSQQ